MDGLLHHMLLSFRLNFRSTQAVVYGFVFPIIFLFAFWGIYNNEIPPLKGELAQLLTVTILSGACFGMPTAMVGERERGVWRRYRLLPSGTGGIVLSAMVVRVVIVAMAVIMQLVIARYVCKAPWPAHPFKLAGIYLFVTFAFLGLGLVIAMLANDVPAVQALGQIIFLPMLMIGGVGVKLSILPDWARHIAAFLPGLYAVEAIDSAMQPVPAANALPLGFCLIALLTIGLAGCAAGMLMFRWDAGQKIPARSRAWVAVALAAWLGVGLAAEENGIVKLRSTATAVAATRPAAVTTRSAASAAWMSITNADIQGITYTDLDPDYSTITPVTSSLERLNAEDLKRVEEFAADLENWPLGKVADLEQRVRYLLAALSIADIRQDPQEWEIAYIVFKQIRSNIPRDQLEKILTYIALNPGGGRVVTGIAELGIDEQFDELSIRERVQAYSRKLLARVIGKVPE